MESAKSDKDKKNKATGATISFNSPQKFNRLLTHEYQIRFRCGLCKDKDFVKYL